MSKKLNWLLAGAATTLIAGAAVAADAQKEAATDSARAGRVERHVYVHRDGAGPNVRVYRMNSGPEGRADHLKTMLQLKPNQEAALKAYLEATKPDRDRVISFEERGEKTTLERLAASEKRMAERQAELKRRNDATRAFYGQLDASQKKVFDTLPMMHGGHHRMAMTHRGPMGFRHHMPHPPVPPVPPVPPEARD